jgi:hypothetical protein
MATERSPETRAEEGRDSMTTVVLPIGFGDAARQGAKD